MYDCGFMISCISLGFIFGDDEIMGHWAVLLLLFLHGGKFPHYHGIMTEHEYETALIPSLHDLLHTISSTLHLLN
jgi:hypothetical protein